MKPIQSHSKNSLFSMEMIFVLLFLALSSAACVRIFASAAGNHVQAVERRQIQAHTVSVSEIMEGMTEVQTVLSSIFSEVFPLPLL